MPELPEVEIVRQSLDNKIKQKEVKKVLVRNRNLRSKIPLNFAKYSRVIPAFTNSRPLSEKNFSTCFFNLPLDGSPNLINLLILNLCHNFKFFLKNPFSTYFL